MKCLHSHNILLYMIFCNYNYVINISYDIIIFNCISSSISHKFTHSWRHALTASSPASAWTNRWKPSCQRFLLTHVWSQDPRWHLQTFISLSFPFCQIWTLGVYLECTSWDMWQIMNPAVFFYIWVFNITFILLKYWEILLTGEVLHIDSKIYHANILCKISTNK